MDNTNILANSNNNVKQPVGFEFKKKCPKCGGNVYLDKDFYGTYEACLQCGYTKNLSNMGENLQKVHSWELK